MTGETGETGMISETTSVSLYTCSTFLICGLCRQLPHILRASTFFLPFYTHYYVFLLGDAFDLSIWLLPFFLLYTTVLIRSIRG